jgi:excisionase family DNA binding protein
MMHDLLTAKEVQELLKLDRTTVYRMLKDGRLTGVKVGQQWRFARQEIDTLLSGERPVATNGTAAPGGVTEAAPPPAPENLLPLHCVQTIQDVFADMAQVGSITTAPDGEPLTHVSNSCQFCSLILSSPAGRRACINSWRRLAEQTERQPHFATCHAGLNYIHARIDVNQAPAAVLIAGQFYAESPDPTEQATRVEQLAEAYDLDLVELAEAAQSLPTLDERTQAQLGNWLTKVAHTFEEVGRERAAMIDRLRRIAAITVLETE